MKTKTAHELARELLAGPDLAIYHFDPSRAGMDEEVDTSVSLPLVEIVEPEPGSGCNGRFITIVGDYDINEELSRLAEGALRADLGKLRKALVGLVGVDGKKDLGEMLGAIALTGASANDAQVMIEAIYALLGTLAPPMPPVHPESPIFAAFLRVLNEAFRADYGAVIALVDARVKCNAALAAHPTIQVGHLGPDGLEVGLLGIVNGICEAITGERVALGVLENGNIDAFVKYTPTA